MKKSAVISLITLFLSFGVQLLANRQLGPSGRGDYALLLLLPQTAGALLAFGFPSAIVYFFNRKPEKFRLYFFSSAAAIVALGFVGVMVCWWLVPSIFSRANLHLGRGELALLSGAGAVIVALATFAASATQIHPERHFYEKARLVQVTVLLTGIGVCFAMGSLSPLKLFFLFCASYGAQFAVGFFVSILNIRALPSAIATGFDRGYLRFAGSVFLMDAFSTLAVNLDKFFLASRVSMAEIGMYAAAFALSRVFAPIAQTLAFRTFSESASMKPGDRSAHTIARARFIALFSFATVAPLIVAPQIILSLLFGESFRAGSLPLVILAVESVLGNVLWNAAQIFAADGKPGVTAIRQAGGLVMLLISCPLLIALWGISGCATALLLATLTRGIITLVVLSRQHGISARSLIPGRADLRIVFAPVLRRLTFFQTQYAKN
jgi:O-antigen/teichoic acid export membrane protein